MKSFPPDLYSGHLSFLTVSNEDVGGRGLGRNRTPISESLLDPVLAGNREIGSLNKLDIKGVFLAELCLIEYLKI